LNHGGLGGIDLNFGLSTGATLYVDLVVAFDAIDKFFANMKADRDSTSHACSCVAD
jgi:hypothetical protein